MPDIITPGNVPSRTNGTIGATFKDLRGATRSTSLPNPANSDLAAAQTVFALMGTVSNASVIKVRANSSAEYDSTDADWVVYDEAFATVDVVGVLVAQDFATNDTVWVEIPAIDAQFLVPGSKSVIDLTNANLAALISAVEAFLNGGGDSYDVVRGYLDTRRSRRDQPTVAPDATQILEPSAASTPSNQPGDVIEA